MSVLSKYLIENRLKELDDELHSVCLRLREKKKLYTIDEEEYRIMASFSLQLQELSAMCRELAAQVNLVNKPPIVLVPEAK